MSLDSKLEDLRNRIAEKGKLLVSYSGGVDSSLLAKVANDVLDGGVLAIFLYSETTGRSELEQARRLAVSMGLNFRVEKFSILADEEFAQNSRARCYVCKKKSAAILNSIAREEGITYIADGVNLSDYQDFRPGIQACNEEGIWHPFVESGISKEDIRTLAQILDLAIWDKPSSACLSSRIPYGERITESNLEMVEEAEEYLKTLGFRQLRVRAHGQTARIELPKSEAKSALDSRDEIVLRLKDIGFKYVTLDLEGFRTGSMNEVL